MTKAEEGLSLASPPEPAWLGLLRPLALRLGGGLVVKNIAWLVVDRLLRMGLGVFVSVWVARYLGPEQFGAFNYAIAFSMLFGALASFGIDSLVVRDLVVEPERRSEILGTAFGLKLTGGLLACLSAVGAIFVFRPGEPLTQAMVALVAAGTIFQAFDTVDLWFQSQTRSKYTVYARSTAFVLVSALKVALILMQAPLIAFCWAGLAEVALGACGLAIAYRATGLRLGAWRLSFRRAGQLLKLSWPLALSGMVIMIYMRIDQIMLGNMLGSKEVGLYSAALRFSEVWYFIPAAIAASTMPAIVAAKNDDPERYRQRLQTVFDLMAGIAYALAIPLSLGSGLIISVLYQDQYAGAAPVLAAHVWAGLFVFLGVATNSYIVSEGLMRFSFITTAMGAVCNVVFNLILIPRHGAFGAAVATVCSQFVAATGSLVLFKATRPIFWMQLRALAFAGPLRRARWLVTLWR